MQELRGHTEHVRAVRISQDYMQMISGSSDNSIRHWDLRMMKAINTFWCHEDSIFAIWVDEHFTRVMSGGKDKL